jgi:ubiquitin-protein ligase
LASFRDQRLNNDYEELMRLQRQLNTRGGVKLEVVAEGSKPYQSYHLYFHCAGYVDEMLTVRKKHRIFLEFPRAYPLEAPPTFKRVSPLFHPNIYPHGVFCLGFEGDRKWRPSVSLESLVLHVSRLIRFDPDWVNIYPPANRTTEFWEEFLKRATLPVDGDTFVVGDESGPDVPPAAASPAATAVPGPTPEPKRPAPTRPTIRIETGNTTRRAQIRPVSSEQRRRAIGPIRIRREGPGQS